MQRGLCGGQGGEGAEQGGPGCSRGTCGCGRGCGCGWSPGLLGRGVRSRGARDLGGCRWGGGGHILCRRVWGEKRTLLASHHGPGITRGFVCAHVLPDAPLTPPAAAHAGLALSGRVELRDGHTVVDEEGGFGDAHSTEPELHAHGEVVDSFWQWWGFLRAWGGARHARAGQQGRTPVLPKVAGIRLPRPQGWQAGHSHEQLSPLLSADAGRDQSRHLQAARPRLEAPQPRLWAPAPRALGTATTPA